MTSLDKSTIVEIICVFKQLNNKRQIEATIVEIFVFINAHFRAVISTIVEIICVL